eukprot:6033459-Amphidinium_carterae.1
MSTESDSSELASLIAALQIARDRLSESSPSKSTLGLEASGESLNGKQHEAAMCSTKRIQSSISLEKITDGDAKYFKVVHFFGFGCYGVEVDATCHLPILQLIPQYTLECCSGQHTAAAQLSMVQRHSWQHMSLKADSILRDATSHLSHAKLANNSPLGPEWLSRSQWTSKGSGSSTNDVQLLCNELASGATAAQHARCAPGTLWECFSEGPDLAKQSS